MAKTSMVEREKRRAEIVKKYAASARELKELIRSPKTSPEERVEAQAELQAQPRDASASGSATAVPSRAVHAACTAIWAVAGEDPRSREPRRDSGPRKASW